MKKTTSKARALARNLTPLSARSLAADELAKVRGGRQVASTSTSASGADDTTVDEVKDGGPNSFFDIEYRI